MKRRSLKLEDDNADLIFFYEKTKGPFINFAVSNYELDRSTAEDIYQNCFIEFYKNLKKGKIQKLNSSLRTYLFGIGKNLLNDYQRRQKRMDEVMLDDLDIINGNYYSDKWNIVQDLVYDTVQQMEEPCNTILNLFYWKKKSMKEIASECNLKSEQLARNKKCSCMKKLKTFLMNKLKEKGIDL